MIILLFMAGVLSCASERQLATRFILHETNLNVLLLPPPGLIKKYIDEMPAGGLEAADLSPLESSRFLADLSDTVFLSLFVESLNYHLARFQVNVFGPEDISGFFELDTNAYIFSLVQSELLEYNDKHTAFTQIDTMVYGVSLPRRNLEFSNWFEFSVLNHDDLPAEVLFSMQNTADYYDGRFRLSVLSGEVTYQHQPYMISEDDLFDLAWFAGRKNAQYIFDYLMNLYVAEKRGRDTDPSHFLQYDMERHAIRRAYDDRFIRLIRPQAEQD